MPFDTRAPSAVGGEAETHHRRPGRETGGGGHVEQRELRVLLRVDARLCEPLLRALQRDDPVDGAAPEERVRDQLERGDRVCISVPPRAVRLGRVLEEVERAVEELPRERRLLVRVLDGLAGRDARAGVVQSGECTERVGDGAFWVASYELGRGGVSASALVAMNV